MTDILLEELCDIVEKCKWYNLNVCLRVYVFYKQKKYWFLKIAIMSTMFIIR